MLALGRRTVGRKGGGRLAWGWAFGRRVGRGTNEGGCETHLLGSVWIGVLWR